MLKEKKGRRRWENSKGRREGREKGNNDVGLERKKWRRGRRGL